MNKITQCARGRNRKGVSCDKQRTLFEWANEVEEKARIQRLNSMPAIHRLTQRGIPTFTAATIAHLAGLNSMELSQWM